MFRRIFLVSLVASALGLASMPAAFATVASASLDWSQFTIDVLAIGGYPTPGLSFITQTGTVSTAALTVNDSSDSHTHTSFNWTSPAEADSTTPEARASATASNQTLHAGSSASPATNPDPLGFQLNNANAQSSRTATLRLDGPGVVAFSLPYDLEVSGPQFDFDDYATASVNGNASFQPDVGFASTNASRQFDLDTRFNPASTQSGPLIFGLVIDGAGTVTVNWQVSTFSVAHDFVMTAVPEPSAALQLLAGLLAIVGIALRRSRVRWPG